MGWKSPMVNNARTMSESSWMSLPGSWNSAKYKKKFKASNIFLNSNENTKERVHILVSCLQILLGHNNSALCNPHHQCCGVLFSWKCKAKPPASALLFCLSDHHHNSKPASSSNLRAPSEIFLGFLSSFPSFSDYISEKFKIKYNFTKQYCASITDAQYFFSSVTTKDIEFALIM